MPIPKQSQTLQKYDAARSKWADLRTGAMSAITLGMIAATNAGAQSAGGDWDISGAQATVSTLVGVGVAITIALVVFKLGKRAANKV